MLFFFSAPKVLLLLSTTFFVFSAFSFSPLTSASSRLQHIQTAPTPGGGEKDGTGFVSWRRSVAEGITPAAPPDISLQDSTFVLAAGITYRKDPLNGYQRYTGGWNISDQHYWASVGFTATPMFIIAIVWFLAFGLVLFTIACNHCCFRRPPYGYSRRAYALSLISLILFTIAAIIGCIILFTGQGKFHSSTSNTLDHVVEQAEFTVDNLRNFSNNLAAAKKVGVDQIFLPTDVQTRIDSVQTKLNVSANTLAARTESNGQKIHDVLNTVALDLIVVASVMLGLAFLGFLFSLLGLQVIVYILVIVGWFLVAGTFILCGVSLLLHNVVADTCIAMEEWVERPHAHTALDDILPCVDAATANESLYRTREVTFQLVNVVNQVISNFSNVDYPPGFGPLYYNQSGPLVPLLCNPFTPDMSTRHCTIGEVNFDNATLVWRTYACEASASGICSTQGRLTPDIFGQMTVAVNISYGLYHYGPFFADLQDCTFVRETFATISGRDCPGLRQHSRWIYIGLVVVSVAVMLSLICWVIFARERRHRTYTKSMRLSDQNTFEDDKGS